jgi:tRNA/rRNA methyltransferase
MAGTDESKRGALGAGPAVILVDPQLGENIGTAARAMLNCGLGELRLVRPRDGWPNEKARAAASGADSVVEGARLFDSTEAAVGDLAHVYATTVRPREMVKPVLTPRAAAARLRAHAAAGEACGVLFGPERAGLTNDDIALADAIVTVPLNPGFASLNLAQAVLLVAYEWFQAGDATPPERTDTGGAAPATQAEIDRLFRHLDAELEAGGFYRVEEKKPSMRRTLRTILQHAALTDQEVRTLHGVFTALSGRRLGGAPKTRGGEGA